MFGIFKYILESKNEILIGLSLLLIYLTYYLLDAVKRPVLICNKGRLRDVLEQRVPTLRARYWPALWCLHAHLQTVAGSLLRSWLLPPVAYRREVLVLPDGGQVALDWALEADAAVEAAAGAAGGAGEGQAAGGALVIVPGITGDGRAEYCRVLVAAAVRLRLRCVVVNYRGLGGMPLTTPRLYCAVSHDDLAAALVAVRARCCADAGGRAPLVAAGVSLGGLVLAQLLAARGAAAGLDAALAVSSPLDVERGALALERGPLNALLARHLARKLVRAAAGLRALSPAACDWAALARCRSVRQFDAALTARHFGFPSVGAYYRAATLRGKLARVRVPLLCLCAADDPFQPYAALPVREAARSSHVALAVAARGGHIGFVEARPGAPPAAQFVARLAADYFAAMLHRTPAPLR